MGSIQGGSDALGLPPKTLIRLLAPFLLVGSLLAPAIPASAAVLSEGKVKSGHYWQKTSSSSGAIRYICRSTCAGKFQKHQQCNNDGAVNPN